jgi:hypothetical protein
LALQSAIPVLPGPLMPGDGVPRGVTVTVGYSLPPVARATKEWPPSADSAHIRTAQREVLPLLVVDNSINLC